MEVWYGADRDVLAGFLYLMALSTNVWEIMKTTPVWFIVTTVTNSKEALKFIVKAESGQMRIGNLLQLSVKI